MTNKGGANFCVCVYWPQYARQQSFALSQLDTKTVDKRAGRPSRGRRATLSRKQDHKQYTYFTSAPASPQLPHPNGLLAGSKACACVHVIHAKP